MLKAILGFTFKFVSRFYIGWCATRPPTLISFCSESFLVSKHVQQCFQFMKKHSVIEFFVNPTHKHTNKFCGCLSARLFKGIGSSILNWVVKGPLYFTRLKKCVFCWYLRKPVEWILVEMTHKHKHKHRHKHKHKIINRPIFETKNTNRIFAAFLKCLDKCKVVFSYWKDCLLNFPINRSNPIVNPEPEFVEFLWKVIAIGQSHFLQMEFKPFKVVSPDS